MKKEKLRELIIKEAEKKGLHFNQVLMIVAYERAIARLVQNESLSESVIFKGGVVMRMAYGSNRFTKDLDASFEGIAEEEMKREVIGALRTDLDDCFEFELGEWSEITSEKNYSGHRYTSTFKFCGSSIQTLQFDFTISEFIGSGINKKLDGLMFDGVVSANIYSPEMILAEKIQTIVVRGGDNTRAKDIYDINFLLQSPIDRKLFKTLVNKVFKIRQTEIPESFTNLLQIPTDSLEKSWSKYRDKLRGAEFVNIWEEFSKSLEKIDNNYRG